MKVLFVLNSGFDTPGPSNHLLEAIIEALLLNECKVHVIAKRRTDENLAMPKHLFGKRNLSYDVSRVKNIDKASFAKRYFADIKYAFSCVKYYRKNKDSDIVFLQSCNTAFFHIFLLKVFLKKPIVYNVQDIFPLNAKNIGMLKEKSPIFVIFRALQREAYKLADRIITISHDMKQTLINEKIDKKKIDVVYNWSYSDDVIDISEEENEFVKENKIECDFYKVVYAGNIGAVQNVEIILKAAELLRREKRIRFYIIGDGLRKADHIKYVEEMGLDNVIFYPMQAPELAKHVYCMADVNVIPLKKGIIKTALPSKTATCLACGRPIIACVDLDSKFARMMMSSRTCSVVSSDDAQGLANKIYQYYTEDLRGQFADEIELFRRVFSRSKNVEKYVEILREIAR
jgi:colanic acid biosynthesis glycosyl transferase WcaI